MRVHTYQESNVYTALGYTKMDKAHFLKARTTLCHTTIDHLVHTGHGSFILAGLMSSWDEYLLEKMGFKRQQLYSYAIEANGVPKAEAHAIIVLREVVNAGDGEDSWFLDEILNHKNGRLLTVFQQPSDEWVKRLSVCGYKLRSV